jgi:thiol-disulfide isomerase/thioredoxin
MKKSIIFLSILFCTAITATAQSTYTTMADPSDASGFIYNGVITKYALQNQPTFTWYADNQKAYTAPAILMDGMKAQKDAVSYLIFGGTWCSDTQNILPKFFKTQEAAGVADAKISFIGVDRQKKSIGNMASVMGITNVPTIIVLKNGKEVGRVVEYGTTGKWDEELGGLLK